MKIAEVQFYDWDKPYDFSFEDDLGLKVGDQVIIKTDLGLEMGEVKRVQNLEENEQELDFLKPILRKANLTDKEKVQEKGKKKEEALNWCKKIITKHNLDMKLIDVYHSFDGGRITFTFTSPGRVDFRELVKGLTRHFQKSVRLHQLGIRDEAKISGDIGLCGRNLCCKTVLKALENISSDLVRLQQLTQRGSDRVSGICGRLMCCLAYEQELYKEMSQGLPEIGAAIETEKGKGKVVGWQVLHRIVEVKMPDGTVVEKEIKK